MCMYPDTSEKWGLSYTNPEKCGQSYTFCWKKGLLIYLAGLKKGAIRHAHPNYRKLTNPPTAPPPPPPPPHTHTHSHTLLIYLAGLKKGAIRHAHPNYAVYRKLTNPPTPPQPPPPPPTHTHTHTHTRGKIKMLIMQRTYFRDISTRNTW